MTRKSKVLLKVLALWLPLSLIFIYWSTTWKH